jgi:type II secretory pathway pseudopilin PulG
MKCRSENTNVLRLAYRVSRDLFALPKGAPFGGRTAQHARRKAFTLVESMAAVTLLAFIGISVWIVLERCTASAADSVQRMRAFEIAHENMEKILGSDSVQETTEYGTSEKFPDIRWQTTIESFYEPLASHMWVRAVCSAEYTDTSGETQNVELINWLTKLSDEQMRQVTAKSELQKQQLAKYIIATEDLAAEFAGVTVETIRQWVKNGMPITDANEYLKPWLDLYLQTEGNPTEEDMQNTLTEYPELSITRPKKATADKTTTSALQKPEEPGSQKPGEPGSQAQPGVDSSDTEQMAPDSNIDPELKKQIEDLLRGS